MGGVVIPWRQRFRMHLKMGPPGAPIPPGVQWNPVPIAKSMSPTLHNTAFQALGLPHIYHLSESDSVEHVGRVLQDPEFGGASVTIPHKEVCANDLRATRSFWRCGGHLRGGQAILQSGAPHEEWK